MHSGLKELEEFIILPEAEINSKPSWFGFPITLKKNTKFERFDFINYLNLNKIQTRLLFSGNLTKQPYMEKVNYRVSGKLVNTDLVMNNTLWIGVYPGLSIEQLQFMINRIIFFFKK